MYKNDDSRPWLTCSCQGMVSIQPRVPPVKALSKLGAPTELPSVCSATSSWFGAHLSWGGSPQAELSQLSHMGTHAHSWAGFHSM